MYVFHLSPATSYLHPLQVENCDSHSRLVVDEDDNGKVRPERVNPCPAELLQLYFPSFEAGIANAISGFK